MKPKAKRYSRDQEWERAAPGLDRLETPEGWIVRKWSNTDSSESICFVPDPDKLWVLEEK